MPVLVATEGCWLCGGACVITTGEAEQAITCEMCAGSGATDVVPGSIAEMVDIIADLPGIEHRCLTVAEIDAAVAEFGMLIGECWRQIEAEERER